MKSRSLYGRRSTALFAVLARRSGVHAKPGTLAVLVTAQSAEISSSRERPESALSRSSGVGQLLPVLPPQQPFVAEVSIGRVGRFRSFADAHAGVKVAPIGAIPRKVCSSKYDPLRAAWQSAKGERACGASGWRCRRKPSSITNSAAS